MGKRKPRPWPDPPNPLALPVIDNHTHLPVHEGEIPRADGVKMPLEEQLERARQVGVTRMISSACELPDFDPNLHRMVWFPKCVSTMFPLTRPCLPWRNA